MGATGYPPGAPDLQAASPSFGDELVAAYIGAGSLQEQPTSYDSLLIQNGRIRIDESRGPRLVLLAYARRTGQSVKRAAAGAEGPVLDHYSAAAAAEHIRWVGDRLLDAVPAELVGSVFCDSLEVYGADWTPDLPNEFAQRRGYPLLPVLHRLVVDGPDAPRVRADYHRTLAELYQENFVEVFRRWAASRGVPFRIQNYGTPPATLSSYRFADLFEGEGWGWQEMTPTRWASSAAHLYGRQVVSAEVWTWVHSPSFRATPLDLKGEAHEHLLNGINQLIGHGWPYSPADAPGLGWFFYAAGAIDDRNPWWPAMSQLNAYLTRLCWLLRQGEPVADVAVYLPTDDLFAGMGTAIGGTLDTWREANRRVPRLVPEAIRAAGLDYDLLDDDAVRLTRPDRYRVVVVPATATIPDPTAAYLQQLIATGRSVIMVNSTARVVGATTVAPEALQEALAAAVDPDLAISPPTNDIGFVHRRCPEADVYLVTNTGPEQRSIDITPGVDAAYFAQWDPISGQVLRIVPGDGQLSVTLHPYQATVVVMTDRELVGPDELSPTEPSRSLRLDEPWQVAFADEPPRPVTLPHVWEEETGRQHFSGAATYTTSFHLGDLRPSASVRLDLGPSSSDDTGYDAAAGLVGPSYRSAIQPPVGVIAQVRVNGVDCGIAWAPPYWVDLSAAVRSGQNELEITVRNTAANALTADEQIAHLVADSEARYGRRFRMQDLDGAAATVRSGLLHLPRVEVRSG